VKLKRFQNLKIQKETSQRRKKGLHVSPIQYREITSRGHGATHKSDQKILKKYLVNLRWDVGGYLLRCILEQPLELAELQQLEALEQLLLLVPDEDLVHQP